MNGNFSANQPYEYSAERKDDPKLKMRRTLLIFLYVAYALVFVFGILLFAPGFVPVIAVMPLTLLAIVGLTWRYVQITNEYACVSGTVTFSRIYGGRARSQLAEFKIKDCVCIAPLDEPQRARITSDYAKDCIIDGLSSPSSPDAYFAEVSEPDRKYVLLFDATNKMIKICKFYNPYATTVSSVRF